jgi:hypothetical protein
VITGAGAYNGTWTITAVPTPRSFEFTHTSAGLAPAGGGTVTYSSPFQVRIGGNDSAVIGGSSQAYSNANIQNAINAIPGFAGTVAVTGAANTGFTVTYGGASAGTDVANVQLVNLSCGGCFSRVDEVNHGGGNDSFTVTYSGVTSVPIVNGVNYTLAGIAAAITPILPAGGTATVFAFGATNAGTALNNQGFTVQFGGTLATTNVPLMLSITNPSPGLTGFFGETDKGGAVDNKGGTITPTGNTWAAVTPSPDYTIPLRTPFVLTGSAVDAEGDALLYSWEQNDRGGTATTLLSTNKASGPLFAMFPKSGQISLADSLLYDSPGQNHLTDSPTRVFPDLQQILDNNTNADTGSCPTAPIAPPVPQAITECYAEFLPTSAYVGFSGGGFNNSSPLSLHFRLTARDGRGGVNAADTTLLLASAAGPFLVTSSPASWAAGSTQTVTWDVASTNVAPVSTDNVKISLSTDGGHTYPWLLAASTPNDGSQAVVVPNTATKTARIKVEAVGNIFFDVSNADFPVTLPGIVGLDSIGLSGLNPFVDSYDSAAGTYPSNRSEHASVFSNGPIALGSASILGDVRSATSSVTLGGGGLVTGSVRAGTAITSQGTIRGSRTPNSPSPTLNPPSVASCSPYSGPVGLSGQFSYNAATGDLTLSGQKTATLAAGTYCFRNVALSGGSSLNVSGPVTIVLNGVLSVAGGSHLNAAGQIPGNLRISSSFAGVNGVSLGGSTVHAGIFAPRTNVVATGGAQLYGAVLGKTLNTSGISTSLHQDLQLTEVWAEYFQPASV